LAHPKAQAAGAAHSFLKECPMQTLALEERLLTVRDHTRLSALVQHLSAAAGLPRAWGASLVEAVLDNAELVPARQIPADVVTMYSQVLVADPATQQRRKLTLCYPDDAQPAQGLVSVLSPVGLGLLGLRPGARARWQLPDGEEVAADVLEVLFQPEASGDYTL
jgi:regulator of nucleoside diphosphate kinase